MARAPREWMTKLRNDKEWSQQQLAMESFISRNYLSEIESGSRNPSVEVAQRIANALGFDWTIFFTDKRRETQHDEVTPA